MKTLQRLPSAAMLAAAVAAIAIPIMRHPQEWQARLCELDTFMLVFTLACTAILLASRRECSADTKR